MARDEAPRERHNPNYTVKPPPQEFITRLARIRKLQLPPDFLPVNRIFYASRKTTKREDAAPPIPPRQQDGNRRSE